jgi:hypothetical protein
MITPTHFDETMRNLFDPEYRACSYEFKGEDALRFLKWLKAIRQQPQISEDHRKLIREHQHVTFTARTDVKGRWMRRPEDILIGVLYGREVIIPKEAL